MVKLFDYFSKQNSLFSKFCVNCLLMFYFVYRNNCVLNDVNGACWCICSLVALRVPECVSGLRRLEKNIELFEMHTCLWSGAQIWFRHNWRKLVTASLLLQCIHWYNCLRYWNEFFAVVYQVLDWSFFVLHFEGNVCNWIPKVIWPLMEWFWGFSLENGFFRRLNIRGD